MAQSPLGVAFHATDVHSGEPVALRRFFPFGAADGGLTAEEQAIYRAAVEQVAAVVHPALRAVIGGGCDPVDGMPFVVTEWVEGDVLAEVLQPGKLKASQAVMLLLTALEVCALLSQTLEQEAVWVDTRLSSIVIGDEASGRGATFWISTSRWLDGGASVGSLEAILQLAEDLFAWCGEIPNNMVGDGLANWIEWLRAHATSASNAQALARLVALVADAGQPPPHESRTLGNAESQRNGKLALPSRYLPLLLAGAAALAVIAGMDWWSTHRSHPPRATARAAVAAGGAKPDLTGNGGPPLRQRAPTPAMAPMSASSPGVVAVNSGAVAMAGESQGPATPHEALPLPGASPHSNINDRGLPVFAAEQTEELMATRNREVIVEGVLVEVTAVRSGRQIYLDFSKPGPPYLARGVLWVERQGQMDITTALDSWVGKRVRMVGRVEIERFRDSKTSVTRPRLMLRGRDVLELLE